MLREDAMSGHERCVGAAPQIRAGEGLTVLAFHQMVILPPMVLQPVTQLLATTPSDSATLLPCVSEAARNFEKSPINEQVQFFFRAYSSVG